MENQTAALISQLGGPERVREKLAEQGIELTRQAISRWQVTDRIGGEYCLAIISACQKAGIDWAGHNALRHQFGLALTVVKHAHQAQRAA